MRIPTYNPQTRPSTQPLVGPSGQGATAEAFGAGIGRGLSNAAQGVGMLANFVAEQDRAKRRTQTLRQFSAFQTRVNDTMTQLGQEHDPGVGNFSDIARATYDNLEAEFINGVDPEFQEEFMARTGEMKVGIASSTLEFQIKQNDGWFRKQLGEELESSRIALAQNATPQNFDMQLNKMEEMLAGSGLSPVEQEVQLRTYRKAFGAILYKNAQVERLLNEDESEGAIPAASALIGTWAGGSEEEQVELAREGEQLALQSIGNLDLWAAMPARARAALISLASDLGEIPPSVVAAVMRGDLQDVSDEIRSLEGERRTQEADLVLDPGAQIDDDDRFNEVPYEDRLALLQDAQTEVLAKETETTKAAKARNEAMINALKVGLFDGTAGMMEIDALREMGVLTKYEDIAQAQKIYDDRNEGLQLTALAQDMLNRGVEFSPDNKEHRDALNAVIGNQGVKALQSRDGDYTATVLVPLVRQARDIPTDALDSLVGMMNSNDQDRALWAMDALAQLQQASPSAYELRTDDATAAAVEFWRTRKDTYAPDELMQLLKGGLTTTERQQNMLLREEAQKLIKDDKLGPGKLDIASVFQTGYFAQNASAPVTPYAAQLLESDFNRLFEDQYTLYGDVEGAKNAATKLLQKTWGPTQVGVNGKVMKYPPEKYYPSVAGSYDWMQRQLVNEGVIADENGFQLIADAETEREVDAYRRGGPPPSYRVIKVVDGQPVEVTQGGANLDPFGNVVEVTPVTPRRQYFDIGPLEADEQSSWRAAQTVSQFQETKLRELTQAERHSLETGIGIPADYLDDINQSFGFNLEAE